jgi:carbon-monoxide dehydrogenase small subunit
MQVHLTVNGKDTTVDVPPHTLLVQVLREQLKLTGTHVGCDTTQCGCCTVHVDGQAVKSCTMLAVHADGCTVTTIEGLGANGLHPLQQAFSQCHGLQCGFCTPGMVMASVDLLRRNSKPTQAEIVEGLSGNLCRCTGYVNIIRAVQQASQAMQGDAP